MAKKWPPEPEFPKKKSKKFEYRVDPRLEINLQRAKLTDQLMAIFHFENVGEDEFRTTVSTLIREIRSQTHIRESMVSIHPAQGFFAVKAAPVFLRAIIARPEISRILDNNPEL